MRDENKSFGFEELILLNKPCFEDLDQKTLIFCSRLKNCAVSVVVPLNSEAGTHPLPLLLHGTTAKANGAFDWATFSENCLT